MLKSEAHASLANLSENQKNKIAKSKRLALDRRAAVKRKAEMAQAQANRIAAKREAALRRRTRILRARADLDDEEGDLQFDDEPNDWQQQSREECEGPPQEIAAAIDGSSPAEQPKAAPAGRKKTTAKQKYVHASAEHKKNKAALKDEWTKRDAKIHIIAATYQTAIPRVNYASSGLIHEVENELRGPKVETSEVAATVPFASEVHPTHRKRLLRNIVFCKLCGYWSSKKTQKLSEKCLLAPPHSDGRAKLKGMLDGYHPDRNVRAWNDGLSTRSRSTLSA